MSKVFITGISPSEKGFVTVIGFLDNHNTGVYAVFNAPNVPYDATLADSLRVQIQTNSVQHINEAISNTGNAAEANVVPSEIEFVC